MAPATGKTKAPARLPLSKLNSMAFGLAVYASQRWLPRRHARLASSRWSDVTGRAFHPQGSNERFQSCILHLILLSQASLGAIRANATLLIAAKPVLTVGGVSLKESGLPLAALRTLAVQPSMGFSG